MEEEAQTLLKVWEFDYGNGPQCRVCSQYPTDKVPHLKWCWIRSLLAELSTLKAAQTVKVEDTRVGDSQYPSMPLATAASHETKDAKVKDAESGILYFVVGVRVIGDCEWVDLALNESGLIVRTVRLDLFNRIFEPAPER